MRFPFSSQGSGGAAGGGLRQRFALVVMALVVVVATVGLAPNGLGSRTAVGQEEVIGELRVTLEEALFMAKEAHPRVEEAAQELNFAQARLDEARWAWFRGVSWENYFGATPVCTELEQIQGSLRCVGKVDVLDPSQYRPTMRGSISIAVPLYTFGKLTSGRRLAEAGVDVSRHRVERARRQVEFDVKRAYWAVLLAGELEAVAREGERRLDEAQGRIEQQELDDSPDFDPRDAMKLGYYRSQVVARRLAAERFSSMAKAGLKAAVGVLDPDLEVRPVSQPLEPLTFELAPIEEYHEVAFLHRPEVEELRAGLAARGAEVDLARARLYPDLVIGGGARYQATAGGQCVIDPAQPDVCIDQTYGYPYAALGVVWSFNLPQGRSRLAQVRAQLGKLEAEGRKGLLALRLEVEDTYRNVEEKLQVVQVHQRGVRSARQWIISNALDYQMGLASLKDLVDALVAQSQARVELNTAIYDLNVALAALARDTGVEIENLPRGGASVASIGSGGNNPAGQQVLPAEISR